MGLLKIIKNILCASYAKKIAIGDKAYQRRTKKYFFNQLTLLTLVVTFFTLPTWAAEVEKMQVGTVTLSATSQKVAITPVVDNKSIVIFNLSTDRTVAGPQDTHLRGQLSCKEGYCDAIDFKRYGSNGSVSIRWQVIEFKSTSKVNVQRGIETQLSMTSNPPQKMIKTGVDRRKSFVLLSEFVSGGVSNAGSFTRGQINVSGNLVLTVGSKKNSASQAEIAWQVIEYPQAVVQRGDVAFGLATTSKTVSINAVDLSKSLLVYNYYSTGIGGVPANPVCQNLVSGTIANATTLQFNRGCADKSGTLNLSWFVVEFADATLVQQNVLSFTAEQHRQTTTLNHAVDASCAMTHLGYHQRGGQSSATTDHTASAWFNAELNKAGTELTLLRGQTNNATAELGWSVVTFAGCGAMVKPKDYGDAPLSGTAPDGVGSNHYGSASHTLVHGMYLGFANPDADAAYQSSLNASGDDRHGIDDDDILSISELTQGGMASFTVFVSGKRGYLQAWVDFDGNGKFDVKEQIATNLQDDGTGDDAIAGDGTIVFRVAIPPKTITNQTYARFRWSTTRNLDAVTTAKDGEVEDYVVTIAASAATLANIKANPQSLSPPQPQTQREIEDVSAPSVTSIPVPIPVPLVESDTITDIVEVTDNHDNTESVVSQPSGVAIKGRVYKDSNVNGRYDAKEKGVSGLPVVLFDVANKTCVSTRTGADGRYVFSAVMAGQYQLYEASREKVPVPRKCGTAYAKDPVAYRSTTDNVLAPFDVVDRDIVGKHFGDVKAPVFTPNNSDKVLAGNVVFYQHTFMPKSVGSVSFMVKNPTAVSASAGWSSAIYHDENCNGVLSGTENRKILSNRLATRPNKAICLINKVVAPNDATNGDVYTSVVTARFDFEYGMAGVIKRTVKNRSKVKAATTNNSQDEPRLELKKTVENLTQGSAETDTQQEVTTGDILQYRIYYSNTGTGVISELVINDIIPDFATLNTVPVCEKPLPAGLTKCTPVVSGRDIHWEFPTIESLQSEQHGVVSYQVKVGE